jgi:two-component system, NarL family, sensor histidine kinase BarA
MSIKESSPINFDALLKLTGQNHELANELLTMFAAELPEMRTTIKRLEKNKNYSPLIAIIHKLHGSCCYCAASRLQQLAKTTETELKEKSYEDIPNLISLIEKEIISIIDYIGQSKVS